ncbi:hypothetical protein [Burkholderia sp. LMU1-1-1.1]|uniref:hypothetical protein n=1 Tax=Burkholderia sp. LMU1-1-1.1 TaxID=3135266 RepID=UPI003431C149
MNVNHIKLSMSRNSSRALVARLYNDDEEIFATSSGYQLGCALRALEASPIRSEGNSFTLGLDEQGTFFGHSIGYAPEERVFFGGVGSALVLLGHFEDGENDPQFHFVRSLLPPELVAPSKTSSSASSQEAARHFAKTVYFPVI